MTDFETAALDLLADLIHEQQKTRHSVTQLAEALASIAGRTGGEETPPPAHAEEPAAPQEAVAVEPSPQPEPVAEAAPAEVTLSDLRKVFSEKSKAGKKDELKKLLFEGFGATKLPEVNAENYAELMAKAEAL